jgi:hypothetical protein
VFFLHLIRKERLYIARPGLVVIDMFFQFSRSVEGDLEAVSRRGPCSSKRAILLTTVQCQAHTIAVVALSINYRL